ncbi:unnamed protein product [Closterium sp. NIES-65]|nr:unnamed protein product [Closterium sp. NIES-65]
MALLSILEFDHDGRPIKFETWLRDLQLFLLSDSRNNVSLYDLTSRASPAPAASADSTTCSKWLTRDAAARLAIRNHLSISERVHFETKTAKELYDTVVAHYSSPTTAGLGRLILPYLSPELSSFDTVDDIITHLRTIDARYRAALPTEFLPMNEPPIYITLYFIVTRLPDSLSAVRDILLALRPTDLTIDLLSKHLLAAETNIVAVGAARGTPCTPFFEGCSASPLAPSVASAAAVDYLGAEGVGAASAPVGGATAAGAREAREARVVGVAAVEAVVVEAVEVVEGAVVAVGVVAEVGEQAVGVVVAAVVVTVDAVGAVVVVMRVVVAAPAVGGLEVVSGSSSTSASVSPSRPSSFVTDAPLGRSA